MYTIILTAITTEEHMMGDLMKPREKRKERKKKKLTHSSFLC
jgi:hypothetical protein